MQGLEIAAIYAVVGVAALVLRRRIPELDAGPLALRLGVGFSVGGLLAIPILMRGTNLVPDRFEATLVAGLIGILAVLVLWLRR